MRRKLFGANSVACFGMLCAVSMTAHAQSVTLYGVVDSGIEYVNHANPSGGSVVRVPDNTSSEPSRWGLTGSEPLGAGWNAIFTLESGFGNGTGTLKQGGRLFGRQAFVGLDGPYGKLTLGRQYTMILWEIFPFTGFGMNANGIGVFDSWLPNSRTDNTISYRKAFGHLNVGFAYSFARDNSPPGGFNSPGEGTCAGSIPGNAQACKEWSAMLSYTGDPWGGGVAYDTHSGGPGAAANMFNGVAPLPLTSSGNRDSRLLVNSYVKFGGFKFTALWINRRVSWSGPEVTSNQVALEGLYYITPFLYVNGYVQRIVNSRQDTRATMEMVNVTYLLSKRTAVYANLAFLQNSKNAAYAVSGGGVTTPGPGMKQLGAGIGIRHSF